MRHSVLGPQHKVNCPRARYREPMRVHVDADKCQGHNRCYAIAPELFDVDDLGYAHELNDGVVPPDLEEKARLAAANCPELAIEIAEES